MNVLMVGVDQTSLGGMLTVVENYLHNPDFCKQTNLNYIPITTHAGKLKKIVFSFKAYWKIVKILKTKSIDIVHVHMSDGGSAYREGVILWTAKLFGCKTISHMHAAEYESWYEKLPNLQKKIVTFLLQKADVVIALGKDWKSTYEFVTQKKTRIEIVYNAVEVPEKNPYSVNSKKILFLAHMIKRKGIDDLLDAIMLIQNKIPDDIEFVLYGADRENNIAKRISSRNLDKIVSYCGWLSGDEKTKCFCDTMINVLPSYNEGLPMTILETMAYGIPNVSTAIAAIPEAIQNEENGYLINPGDVDALADRMLTLINNQDKRIEMSNRSYEITKLQFGLENHFKKILQIYDSLIK